MNKLIINRPGIESFIPTHAICVNAIGDNGELRNMVLHYRNTDGWLGKDEGWYMHEELMARLNRLLHEDATVVAFKNQLYRVENGVHILCLQTVTVQK